MIHDVNNLTGVTSADLFSAKGEFQGTYNHPNKGLERMYFRGKYAYTIEKVDDENYMVRYRVQGLFR